MFNVQSSDPYRAGSSDEFVIDTVTSATVIRAGAVSLHVSKTTDSTVNVIPATVTGSPTRPPAFKGPGTVGRSPSSGGAVTADVDVGLDRMRSSGGVVRAQPTNTAIDRSTTVPISRRMRGEGIGGGTPTGQKK